MFGLAILSLVAAALAVALYIDSRRSLDDTLEALGNHSNNHRAEPWSKP